MWVRHSPWVGVTEGECAVCLWDTWNAVGGGERELSTSVQFAVGISTVFPLHPLHPRALIANWSVHPVQAAEHAVVPIPAGARGGSRAASTRDSWEWGLDT